MANKNTRQARKRGATNGIQGHTTGMGSDGQTYTARRVEKLTKGRNVDSAKEREESGKARWSPPKHGKTEA